MMNSDDWNRLVALAEWVIYPTWLLTALLIVRGHVLLRRAKKRLAGSTVRL